MKITINNNTVNLLSKAKQSKAKQSKAKQSKAKQSKAKQSHNCLLNNNFKFYISQFLKAFKFLSVSILLQKFLSNKKLIFELSQFNQNFNFARNIYLNVFNKYQKESSKMKEQRKNFYLLLIILSLIALFSISCDNKNKTGTEGRTLSYYAGNWWAKNPDTSKTENIFTINTDGSITLKPEGSSEVIIPSSSVTRVSNTHYTIIDPTDDSVKYIFIFSSDTQGKFTTEASDGHSLSLDITKK